MNLQLQITEQLRDFGIAAESESLANLTRFAESVLEFNPALGLVSKKEPDREVVRQIADSAALLKFISFEEGASLLDLGSGAGFPGIVLKLLRPGISLESLDASPKKILFQEEAARRLRLTDCTFTASEFDTYRPSARFDLITVKAVGRFKKLLPLAQGWLNPTGRLCLYVGEDLHRELSQAAAHFGGMDIHEYTLPGESKLRQLVVLTRLSQK